MDIVHDHVFGPCHPDTPKQRAECPFCIREDALKENRVPGWPPLVRPLPDPPAPSPQATTSYEAMVALLASIPRAPWEELRSQYELRESLEIPFGAVVCLGPSLRSAWTGARTRGFVVVHPELIVRLKAESAKGNPPWPLISDDELAALLAWHTQQKPQPEESNDTA